MAASGTVTNLAITAENILQEADPTNPATGFDVVSCKNAAANHQRTICRWDMTGVMSPDPGTVVISNAKFNFTISTVPAEGLTGQTWWVLRYDLDGAAAMVESWNSATSAGRIDGVTATKVTQALTTGTADYEITGKGGLVDSLIADAVNNRSRVMTTIWYIDPAAAFFNFTQGLIANFKLSFDWQVVSGGIGTGRRMGIRGMGICI